MKSIHCQEVIPRLRLYFEGKLSDQDELEMDDHLDQCEACTEKLNALIESEENWQLTQQEQTQILRELRTTYTLDPDQEREGVEKILAEARQIWSESKRLAWAAANVSETDEIRERIGMEFEKRGPLSLGFYTAEPYIRDRNSALLEFRKGNMPTSELDGKTIEFYVIEKPRTAEMSKLLSKTIQAGTVVIDFTELGISIEDYAKVGFKLYLDELTVIEESLGHETPS